MAKTAMFKLVSDGTLEGSIFHDEKGEPAGVVKHIKSSVTKAGKVELLEASIAFGEKPAATMEERKEDAKV